ncbi:recombinase family protein [Ralstonia sp. RRA.1]|uniref:recombinase family protein n=1 Tax=Ralstonia sp. RRA TaxID=3122075 RepID=UPI0030CD93F4
MPDTPRTTPAPLAYSYIRFSTARQADGDSLRRQNAKAAEYAARKGLQLDESLTYRDLGVSAYDRSNVTKGALGLFLAAVEAGKVPPGSFLLVEQLDRLSRADPMKAIDVIRTIVDGGVSIITLTDESVIDKSNASDLGVMLNAIVVMSRAHEESKRKSQMLSDFWQEKRVQRPPVLTAECPRWLRVKPDRSGFEPIPEKAESVRRVIELMAGGFGNVAIARRANAEKWPVPGLGDSWHATLVSRIARNRAVIGEHQPHKKTEGVRLPIGEPWPDYYPAVVDETLFNLATAARANRADLPRRRDNRYLNVFQGVIKCACGSSLSRKYKGSSAQPGYVQYQCTDRIRGVTNCKSISALKLHPALLRGILETDAEAVADDDFTTWARDEVTSAETVLREEQAKLANLLDMLEGLTDRKDSPALLLRIRQREQSINERKQHLERVTKDLLALMDMNAGNPVDGTLQETLDKLTGDEHIDYRAALHERILRAISSIVVNTATMFASITWRNGRAVTQIPLE